MGLSDSFEGISSAVSGFNPDEILTMGGPLFAKFYFFIKIFFWFFVVVMGCILIYKFFLQYKILITVKTKIGGGGLEVKKDKAKIIVDKHNKRKLVLFKLKNGKQRITCPIPSADFKSKIGKRDHYEMWLDDNFQLHPIEPPEIEAGKEYRLKIRPQERDAWARFEDKNLQEKYKKKDLLEKYVPAAILMIAMLTAFLIWFFAVKQLGAGLSDLAGQFAQIASSCTKLG